MGSTSIHLCNTGLSLGLEGFKDTVHTKKEKPATSPAVVLLKFDQVLPCLSLGPTSDQGSSSYSNNNNNNTTSDQEEEEASPRKKLRLTRDQSAVLEDVFKEHNTLNPNQKQALAKQLNLRPRQVEVWFQNRRARTKLKQTEIDCELLKKCCERLTEENKRLQKELHELKSLKVAAAATVYMPAAGPATTLSICPCCEKGATTPPLSGAHHGYEDEKAGVFVSGMNGMKPPPFFPHSSAAC